MVSGDETIGPPIDWKIYELGVADVMRHIYGGEAIVEHNVRLPGKKSGGKRQVDVVVQRSLGPLDVLVVVDCKRHRTNIDVKEVDSFIGLVEDVGAEIGLLVCDKGYSKAANQRANSTRGIEIRVMTPEQLAAWSPAGTVVAGLELDSADVGRAEVALWSVDLRTRRVQGWGQIKLEVFRHYGERSPSTDTQEAHRQTIENALSRQSVPYFIRSHGIVLSGGTHRHQWIDVLVGPPVKVLAANQNELEAQLQHLADSLEIPREWLHPMIPEGWGLEPAARDLT